MALSGEALGSLIESNFRAVGAKGAYLQIFWQAIGKGIVDYLKGKAFATVDVGGVAGAGVGTGIGIMGLNPDNMKSLALQVFSSKGAYADRFLTAIMKAIVEHLSSNALLSSIHTPVFAGTGTIVIGSFAINKNAMAASLESELSKVNAKGIRKQELCLAIATGVTTDMLSTGTGTVIITGSPSGDPSGGAGAGTGVIG